MEDIKRRLLKLILLFVLLFRFEEVCLSNDDILERITVLNERLGKIRQEQIKRDYRNSGKRDPFVSPVGISAWLKNMNKLTSEERDALPNLPFLGQIKNLHPFTLSGIVYSKKGDSLAIINNKIVKMGEEVGGARVVGIELSKVKLLWKNKEIYLSTEGSIEGGTK